MLNPVKTKGFRTRTLETPVIKKTTTANINLTKLNRPPKLKLPVNLVAAFRPETMLVNLRQGTPKSALKVPFTDENEASELLLYTLNSDPEHKRFVPCYKIGVHRISGAQQFKIELKEATEGEGGFLKVSLESVAADELSNKLNGALPMDHTTGITLRFTVPGTGIDKRMPFEELLKTDTGYDATLRITSFMEFNQVFAAISENDYQCRLEILRSVSVALPQFVPPKSGGVVGPNPILAYTRKESSEVRGVRFNRIHLSIKNWDIFPDALFKASPELPPCGLNKKASRTWLEILDDKGKKLYGYCAFSKNKNLQKFSFAVRADKPLPKACYIALWDRKTNRRFTSNKINLKVSPQKISAEAGEKMYKVLAKEFLQTEAFHFSADLHAYIFRNSGTRDTVAGGFKPFRIKWERDGSEYVYLQEEVNPVNFFYLPDQYVLAREEAPLYKPKFSARLTGTQIDNLTADINYQADAYVQTERLEDALDKLTALSGVKDEDISFSPLVLSGERLAFKLSIPGSPGFKPRPDSLLTLENIQDSLPPIDLATFEELFNNLTQSSSSSSMLTGHVEADVPGIPVAPVPVSLRLTQANSEMLAVQPLQQTNFQLEIKNNTAHSLTAQGVVVDVHDGENTLSGSKANLELPLTLAPGAIAKFAVIPNAELDKPDSAVVSLTWEGTQKHNGDGSLTESSESFALVNQQLGQGDSILVVNPIESTLKVDQVKGFVQSGDKEVPLVIKNLELPMVLPSGESVSFDVVPAEVVGEYKASDLSFNWEGLRSEPDKSQLFDSIVDTSINATYESLVKVSLFIEAITADSTNRLLKVEFKNSENGPLIDTLIFNAGDFPDPPTGNVEKDITLPLPIKDYVMGAANSGQYWYRIVLIKKTDGGVDAGSKNVQGRWQAKSGSLEITTDMLPKE
jgi:hypothetical protein